MVREYTQSERGVGSVEKVLHSAKQFVFATDAEEALDNLAGWLNDMLAREETQRATLCVLAAFLNRFTKRTGCLYHISESGLLVSDYVISDAVRDIIIETACIKQQEVFASKQVGNNLC